jgi:hypothetical protein
MIETQREKRFGTIAVEMGFITTEQVLHAMNIQIKEDIENGKHWLLWFFHSEGCCRDDRPLRPKVGLTLTPTVPCIKSPKC